MPNDKLTIDQFAEKIKAKYPEYKEVDNSELANRIIQKYPEYKDAVDLQSAKKKVSTTESFTSGIPLQKERDITGKSPLKEAAQEPEKPTKSLATVSKSQKQEYEPLESRIARFNPSNVNNDISAPVTVNDFLKKHQATEDEIDYRAGNMDKVLQPEDQLELLRKIDLKRSIRKANEAQLHKPEDSYFWGFVKGVNKQLTSTLRDVVAPAERIVRNAIITTKFGTASEAIKERAKKEPTISEKLADVGDEHLVNNLADAPDNIMGRVASSVGQMAVDVPLMIATPEVKLKYIAEATNGLVKSIPSVVSYLALTNAAKTYEDESKKGTPEFQKILKSAQSAQSGAVEGAVMHSFGLVSGKTGEFVKGITGSNVADVMSRMVTNAASGAAMTAGDQLLQGKELEGKEIAASAVTFAAMGLPDVAKAFAKKASDRYFTSSIDDIKKINDLPQSVSQLREKQLDIQTKADAETDPVKKEQLQVASNSIDAVIDVKAVNNQVLSDPATAINSIKADESLTPEEKDFGIQKINEAVAGTDPRIQAAQPMMDEMERNKQNIEATQNNTAMPEVTKQAFINSANKRNEELGKLIEKELSKPLTLGELNKQSKIEDYEEGKAENGGPGSETDISRRREGYEPPSRELREEIASKESEKVEPRAAKEGKIEEGREREYKGIPQREDLPIDQKEVRETEGGQAGRGGSLERGAEIKEKEVKEAPEKIAGATSATPKEAKSIIKSTGKKILSDFDDTLFDTKTEGLTELGKDVKNRIAAGEEVKVLTHREDTPENRKQISDMLGIKDENIKMGLSPEAKAEEAAKEQDALFLDDKSKNIEAVAGKGVEAVKVEAPEEEIKPEKAPRELSFAEQSSISKSFAAIDSKSEKYKERLATEKQRLKDTVKSLKDKFRGQKKELRGSLKEKYESKLADLKSQYKNKIAYEKKKAELDRTFMKEEAKVSVEIEKSRIKVYKQQINDFLEANKESIRKMTGAKVDRLAKKVNGVSTQRQLEKALDWIDKAVSDTEYLKSLDEIKGHQETISKYLKKGEFSKGASEYYDMASKIVGISSKIIDNMPADMLKDLASVSSELARKKVSDVKNLTKFYNEYKEWAEDVYDTPEEFKVATADSLGKLSNLVTDFIKTDTSKFTSIEDFLSHKRKAGLIQKRIEGLLLAKDLSFVDGKFVGADGKDSSYEPELAEAYSKLTDILNDKDALNKFSAEELKAAEDGVKSKLLDESKLYLEVKGKRYTNIDRTDFNEADNELIDNLYLAFTDKNASYLTLNEADLLNKVAEQLTYGNAPSKLSEVIRALDRGDYQGMIENNFIGDIRRISASEARVKKTFENLKRGEFYKQLTGITQKGRQGQPAYLSDIGKKYGINKTFGRVLDYATERAFAQSESKTNDRKNELMDKYLANGAMQKLFTYKLPWGKLIGKEKIELYEREVQLIQKILNWQTNIPDVALEKIAKRFDLSSPSEALHWGELAFESDKGSKIFADQDKTLHYTQEQHDWDRKAYDNLKKRNGGKPILFDKNLSDTELLGQAKKLLSNNQYKHLTSLMDGYKAQLKETMVNARNQGVDFTSLRFYTPDRVIDRTVDEWDANKDFVDQLNGGSYVKPTNTNGHVNEKTWDFHFVRLNATENFKNYTSLNMMNYFMREPVNSLLGAMAATKNAGIKNGDLSNKEIQLVSELSQGLKQRMVMAYATKPNVDAVTNVMRWASEVGRIILINPFKITYEHLSNALTAVGQVRNPLKLAELLVLKAGDKDINALAKEEGAVFDTSLAAEYSEDSKMTRKQFDFLSFSDSRTSQKVFHDTFVDAFKHFAGYDIDPIRYREDMEYKRDNREYFNKAMAEARHAAVDMFPSTLKIINTKKPPTSLAFWNNFMMSFNMRDAHRFVDAIRDIPLNTNEGSLIAAKKLASYSASGVLYGMGMVVNSAAIAYAGGALMTAWDEESGEKVKERAKKKVSRLSTMDGLLGETFADVLQIPMGYKGNLIKYSGKAFLSLADNLIAQGRSTEQLRDEMPNLMAFNDYIKEQFYITPIMLKDKPTKLIESTLELAGQLKPIIETMAIGANDTYVIGKKLVEGEQLNSTDYNLYSALRLVNWAVSAKWIHMGSGFAEKELRTLSYEQQTKMAYAGKEWQSKQREILKTGGYQDIIFKAEKVKEKAETLAKEKSEEDALKYLRTNRLEDYYSFVKNNSEEINTLKNASKVLSTMSPKDPDYKEYDKALKQDIEDATKAFKDKERIKLSEETYDLEAKQSEEKARKEEAVDKLRGEIGAD